MNPSPFHCSFQRFIPSPPNSFAARQTLLLERKAKKVQARGPLATQNNTPLQRLKRPLTGLSSGHSYFPTSLQWVQYPAGTLEFIFPLHAQVRNNPLNLLRRKRLDSALPQIACPYRFDHARCGGPEQMFIESVIAMCDRIMRRAAEANPAVRCFHEIPVEVNDNDTAPKVGNFGFRRKQ